MCKYLSRGVIRYGQTIQDIGDMVPAGLRGYVSVDVGEFYTEFYVKGIIHHNLLSPVHSRC